MLIEALVRPGRVETFRRDGWARPWPAGLAMLAYMITDDAHHRGQACMLAHQLGFPLPAPAGYGILGLGKALEAMRIHSPAMSDR